MILDLETCRVSLAEKKKKMTYSGLHRGLIIQFCISDMSCLKIRWNDYRSAFETYRFLFDGP